jgi:hypothetical protein
MLRPRCVPYANSSPLSILILELPLTSPGGWDPQTGIYSTEINAQIEQAFANVDLCLKDAGGKGWSQVFRVNSYHVPINNEALAAMKRGFEKWIPGHKPIVSLLALFFLFLGLRGDISVRGSVVL